MVNRCSQGISKMANRAHEKSAKNSIFAQEKNRDEDTSTSCPPLIFLRATGSQSRGFAIALDHFFCRTFCYETPSSKCTYFTWSSFHPGRNYLLAPHTPHHTEPLCLPLCSTYHKVRLPLFAGALSPRTWLAKGLFAVTSIDLTRHRSVPHLSVVCADVHNWSTGGSCR